MKCPQCKEFRTVVCPECKRVTRVTINDVHDTPIGEGPVHVYHCEPCKLGFVYEESENSIR